MSVKIENFCGNSKAVVIGNDVFGLEVGDILYTKDEVKKAIQEAVTEESDRLEHATEGSY